MRNLIHFLLCLLPFTLSSQSCLLELKGTVSDADNREGLAYAYIKLQPGAQLLQTDEQGKFHYKGLCSGTYTLFLQHLGCRDTFFILKIEKDKRVQYTLPHALNELRDIEIITRHEAPAETQNVQVLDKKALDKVAGQSLADQLKQLNGVTTLNTGPTISKPMINGMQGYRVLILNNGVRLEGQQWGNEHAPELDPYTAGRITLLRGASAVRYGSDAIGGVILSAPADLPSNPDLSGELSTSGFTNGRGGTSSLWLQGKSEKVNYLSWRMQASMKEHGSIRSPDYFLKNTGSSERNFSGLVDYHRKNLGVQIYYARFTSTVGVFSGSHIGNLSDLSAAFNSNKPQDSLAPFSYVIDRPKQLIQHDLLKVAADVHTGPRSRFNFLYSWQENDRQEFDKNLPRNQQLAILNLPAAQYKLQTQTLELIWEHDYIRSFRGMFGIQGALQNNRYTQKFFIPNYDSESAGIFAMERFVRPAFELEAGLRMDYKHLQSFFYEQGLLKSPELTFTNQSFQLGILLKPLQRLRISLHGGNGWRAPAANELYSNGLHHGVGAIERGNSALEKEKCLNVIMTTVFQSAKWQSSLTAYHYAFSNFIYYQPGLQPELTVRGAFPVFNYAQCKADISGADLLLRYAMGKDIAVQSKTMWLHGTNRSTGEALIYMPANRSELSLQIKFRSLKKIKGIFFEPGYSFVMKQNRVPAGLDFISPPPAYGLFSANAGCELLFIKNYRVYLNLSVTNATNTRYRDYLDRFRYYNDAAGVNYTLRLRIPFQLKSKKTSYENTPTEKTEN